jgi:NCS1 family nucleobase:cation symporter-1
LERQRAAVIESHSIEFIPPAARYGTPRRLFTFWFSANMTILGVALGSLGITAGLSLSWAIIACLVGNVLGTIFMAAHSAQGPQLGIPQMIQSRAQFGVRGAGLPLVAVVLTYLLYCAANGILIRGTLREIIPISNNEALLIFATLTLVIAFIGYELIHRLAAVLTVISTLLFAVAAFRLLTMPAGTAAVHSVSPALAGSAFILTMTQAAAWSLSYGPYVADYSRYLPPTVSQAATFWYTGLGNLISSTLIMAFGACLAWVQPQLVADPGNALASLFGSGRVWVGVLILVGVVQGNVMNLYSAYMSSLTIFSGKHGMHGIGRVRKLLIMGALITIAMLISLWAQDNFQAYFGDALNAMVYILVPWSAINLADYYLVRKGIYNVADMYRVEGEYGAFRWQAIGVYLLGVVIQEPFMSLTFHQGMVTRWIGADLAWIPGLLVPGLLYPLVEQAGSRRTTSEFSS